MSVKLSSRYEQLFQQPDDVRYYVITGGRGSSKSFTVSLWNLLKSFEANSKTLYTRYTLTSARKSIIPEFEEKIDILNVAEVFDVTNNEIINTRTGSSILFSGIKTSSGNQTANLKSLQGVSTWIVDEAEELDNETTFDKIDLSIRSKESKNIVILILNPTTKEHWIYKRFFEDRGVEGGYNGIKGDTCYIHTTYLDNEENLSASFLNSLDIIKRNNPEKYQHQILGGWRNKAEGVIFENWEVGAFDDNLPFWYGLDFGFVADPDSCVRVSIDESRKLIYIKEEFYEHGQTIDQLSHRINRLDRGSIVADSAEQRLINDLTTKCKRSILPVKKGAGSIMQGIKLMQNYRLVVTSESTNIIKELNNYCWNGKAKEAPIDFYNHAIDAIRYVVFTYANRANPKQPKYEDTNTRFIKGDTTGFNAANWNGSSRESSESFF